MTTSSLVSPADLAEYEFDIPCEFPGCKTGAVVMSKGCADSHHRAVCQRHYEGVRKYFFEHLNVRCLHCHRPWVHFETHYDIVPI